MGGNSNGHMEIVMSSQSATGLSCLKEINELIEWVIIIIVVFVAIVTVFVFDVTIVFDINYLYFKYKVFMVEFSFLYN